MNRIIVSKHKYGNSPYKVYNLSPGDYNIGDVVEIQEGGSSRLAVIRTRTHELSYGNVCSECVFRDKSTFQSVPCGYVTSDGWFPCVAICISGASVMFQPVDTIMEDL